MKRLFVLFFLRLLSTLIFAQSIELKGIVIDSITSSPIAYAGVGVKSLGIGTLTNEQGKFVLKLPNSAQDQIIYIQILGYKSYSFTFENNNSYVFLFFSNKNIFRNSVSNSWFIFIDLNRSIFWHLS